MGDTPTEADISSVADMVYFDLRDRFRLNEKVPLGLVIAQARGTLQELGLDGSSAKVLSVMERKGYVQRFGRDYTLKVPDGDLTI